jgi:pimeloyl-ACP methyl ester carboxylesterase
MQSAFPRVLDDWAAAGRYLTVHGHQVFVHTSGEDTRPALLLLHGFPTCSLDFRHVVESLSQDYFVVVHDHLGFGLSDKPERYSYSLMEQAEMALGVWRALGIDAGHLIAHDMGTSIATEILARRERSELSVRLLSVTLCNGSIRLDLASLTWPQKMLKHPVWGPLLARFSSRAFFERRLRKVLADPESMSAADLAAEWAALVHGGGRSRIAAISGYLDERVRFLPRWWGALGRLDLPCHVLWGAQDPVALPAIAVAVAEHVPSATLTWIPGVGHYPMIEAPEVWVAELLDWLGRAPSQ